MAPDVGRAPRFLFAMTGRTQRGSWCDMDMKGLALPRRRERQRSQRAPESFKFPASGVQACCSEWS
jgi:hypothetical protein